MSAYDDPSMHDAPSPSEVRDRAALARVGGRQLTLGHFGDLHWTPEVEREAAIMVHNGPASPFRPTIPQDAFDWPIYQAALYPQRSCLDCGFDRGSYNHTTTVEQCVAAGGGAGGSCANPAEHHTYR